MLWWTWDKWPDIFIDFGRELYVPWQLSLGEVLYRDIAYFNGPLSPYFNSLWFRLFGPHMVVLILVNVALLFFLIVLVHTLVRRISNRSGAVAASMMFVALFAFGDYDQVANYNYICPYSHEMVHGILLSLGALLCMMAYCENMGMKALCAASLLTGLVFLTKAEIFLALFCSLSMALISTLLLKRATIPTLLKSTLSFSVSMALPPIIAASCMVPVLGPVPALKSVAGSFFYLFTTDKVARLPLYMWGMGTDDVGGNLIKMLTMSAVEASFLAVAALLGILFRYSGRRHPVIPTSVFVLCTLVFGYVFRTYWASVIGRPLPLILLVIAAALTVSLVRRFRSGCFDSRPVQRLAFLTFALVLLGKMLLNSRVDGYGFVLAMPAAMVVTVLIVDWLPGCVSLKGGFGRVSQAAGIAILLVVSGQFVHLTSNHMAAKTVPVSNGSDTILAYPRGLVANEALAALQSIMNPGETMAVVPEGVMLNYLLRVQNPTPYINFMPPEVLMFGEENMVAAFEAHRPDYIIAVPRPVREYGFQGFGNGYASRLVAWIGDNYEELKSISPETTRKIAFGKLTILRLKQP